MAVALEMRFVPAPAPGGAVYRGITVHKVVRLYDALALTLALALTPTPTPT